MNELERADSCPTKCSTTPVIGIGRIATPVLIMPVQAVARRLEPPSPHAQIGFTLLRHASAGQWKWSIGMMS